jgi:exopolysaccharide biosynthesis polyprenyl glycosylphosphotransferase
MEFKETANLSKFAVAFTDLGLITLAFYLSYWLRFESFSNIGDFVWLYYFSAPLILFLLYQQGVLMGFRYQRLRDIFRSAVMAFVVAGLVSSTLLYLAKAADYSRLLFGQYFAIAALFVLGEKVVVKKFYDRQLRRGRMNILVALVGYGEKFDKIRSELRERPQWGISPVLIIDPRDLDIASIVSEVRANVIDEVYVSYPRGSNYHSDIDQLLLRLEILGLPVRVALNFDELQPYYGQQACALGSHKGLMLEPHNLDRDQLLIKRCLDIFGATVGLILLVAMFPIIALAIKLSSSGPIFFSQIRVGKGGRRFRIFKFRSMYHDAELRKHELMGQNVHSGPLFKMDDDPRITPVGRFIRKYSLDEFPQFLNVLAGDMSLVGTRPPTIDEVSAYEDHHYRRISIKPGLTGLWQVSGRNDIIEFDEVVALDVEYIKNWNLLLDLKILLRTVLVVVAPGLGTGK